MPFPPELYLIGTQKGGTTFLATLLGQHPDICLAHPKEPHYYSKNFSRGLNWYRQRFINPDARYLLDSSTSYSAAPLASFESDNCHSSNPLHGIPERIHSVAPNARFIYLLRDPVKRTYSSYWHDVRGGYEKRGFRDAVRNSSYYLRIGHYYEQLELYLKYFSKDAFLVLLFENFIEQPQETANKCLLFLGLNELNEFAMEKGKNVSFNYKPSLNRINQKISKFGGLNRVVKVVKPLLPSSFVNKVFNLTTEKIPALTDADKRYLTEYFRDRNQLLQTKIGLSLDKWSK